MHQAMMTAVPNENNGKGTEGKASYWEQTPENNLKTVDL